MSDLERTSGQSPFDAIRRIRPDGSEFWSAREYMGPLGYGADWRNFVAVIERARAAADNQGYAVSDLFVGVTEKSGGRPREDFELSRFACYLVAMNGDPRKPEIAAAQAYFAIRTREAEISQAIDLSDPLAVIEAQSARVQKAVEIARGERLRAEKAERKLEVEQRHRRAIEGGDGIHLTDFGKKYFSEVPARKFDEHLYSHGWLINQHNTRVRADGAVRDGYDHRKPTAKGRPYIYDHDQGNYGGRRRFQPRVRPQKEIELRDRLAAEGLPVNEHSTGLVLITNDDLKELGA
ncbi:antirepressor [Mycobacterium phage dwieneke]|nr:antirepressor [Mycobacterium phage dwieneke]